MELFHGTATECHLPYGITQSNLLPDTSEQTPSCWRSEIKDQPVKWVYVHTVRSVDYVLSIKKLVVPFVYTSLDLWRTEALAAGTVKSCSSRFYRSPAPKD